MKRAVILLPVVLLLAGCSAGPSRDEVLERFSIEIRGAAGADLPASMVEDQAAALTDAALQGECGSDEYRDSMIVPSLYLLLPWDATCSMYFEDDMTAAQVERAKQTVLMAALDN